MGGEGGIAQGIESLQSQLLATSILYIVFHHAIIHAPSIQCVRCRLTRRSPAIDAEPTFWSHISAAYQKLPCVL